LNLEDKFHLDMRKLYDIAKEEAGYTATRFIQLVSKDGGLKTAKKLILKDGGSEGFVKLWERGRLELTVEALVLNSEYRTLFTEEEINICKSRLNSLGYFK